MKRIATLAGIFIISISATFSQSIDNAYLFSSNELIGTGRFVAMGGAFGAFGANQSAVSVNPAGIALYRRGETSMTLSVNDMMSTSSFMGGSSEAGNSIFAFDNIGMVSSARYDDTYVRGNMGVIYNKQSNFNESYIMTGTVEGTSLLDVFANQANGTLPEDVATNYFASAGLAYDAFLINPYEDNETLYFTEIPYGELTQTKTIDRTGRKGETLIAGGANVDNKVYFGLSMGFPSIHFEERSTHSEGNLDPSLELDQFYFNEELVVDGNGFNIKAGVIVQANEWLRLGGSYHSPSWMSMSGVFTRDIHSRFRDGDAYDIYSDPVNYIYNFRTPARYNINTGVIVGKKGLIGADYEFVNYNSMKFSDPRNPLVNVNYSNENSAIKEAYKGTHNFRVGGEFRVQKDFAVRAGFNYRQDPYEEGITETSGNVLTYTGGFGYRKQAFYADLAYAFTQMEKDHYLYDPNVTSAAILQSDEQQIILTVGFRY